MRGSWLGLEVIRNISRAFLFYMFVVHLCLVAKSKQKTAKTVQKLKLSKLNRGTRSFSTNFSYLLWPPNGIKGRPLCFCPVVSSFYLSIFLSFFFFILAYSQPSQIGWLLYFHTWCGLSANLRYRSEMYCKRLAEKYRTQKNRQKFAICAQWHNFVGLSPYLSIFATIGTYR